jgi:DNA-binding CsgD family transcriptional regulator
VLYEIRNQSVQIKKIKKIVDYLGSHRTLSELVIFLGTNVCLSGDHCKVYVGKIESNGVINHLANFGYTSDDLSSVLSINVTERRPICDAVNSNSMIIATKSPFYYDLYKDIVPFSDPADPWQSIICIPLLPNYTMTFLLKTPVKLASEESDYYELLHSLLSFYMNVSLHSERQAGITNFHTSSLKDKPLTLRQQVILEMMKKRMTNREIAREIRYSESLVRQETITIFAKLGFAGRKDLKNYLLLEVIAETNAAKNINENGNADRLNSINFAKSS